MRRLQSLQYLIFQLIYLPITVCHLKSTYSILLFLFVIPAFNYSVNCLMQVTEGDMASPVDMAKSYMRSRPPWASQSWNNTELKTPPPIGILHYSDESSHPMAHYSSPLTKVLSKIFILNFFDNRFILNCFLFSW